MTILIVVVALHVLLLGLIWLHHSLTHHIHSLWVHAWSLHTRLVHHTTHTWARLLHHTMLTHSGLHHTGLHHSWLHHSWLHHSWLHHPWLLHHTTHTHAHARLLHHARLVHNSSHTTNWRLLDPVLGCNRLLWLMSSCLWLRAFGDDVILPSVDVVGLDHLLHVNIELFKLI